MPQTTGAINTVNAVLELSTDGSNWTDISGSTNKVEAPSQEADTGDVATLEGQFKIVKSGKFGSLEVGVTVLYTEEPDEAYDILTQQAAVDGRPLWVRWSPAGGNIGDLRYFTADANGNLAAGTISSLPFPGADAETAAATVLQFKVRTTTLGSETISA